MRDVYSDAVHGVTVSFLHGSAFSILTGVETNVRYRGKGHAARVLRLALSDADIEAVTVILAVEAQPDSSMNDEQLRAWYEREGFVPHPDGETAMIREPKRPASL